MPVPEHLRTCSCGRLCASRSGLATHARACRTALAASAAFVGAIEAGLGGDRAIIARRIAIFIAQQRPGPSPEAIAADAIEAARAARVPRRCHCGRTIPADSSEPFCAEHDDAPAPQAAR